MLNRDLTRESGRRWLAGAGGGLITMVVMATTFASPSLAEQPSLIVAETADDGTYVAASRQATFNESMFVEVIARARSMGISLIVVVPDEAEPSTTAFALRSREAADVDVAIVFGPDELFAADVADEYEETGARALNAAREANTPTDKIDVFLTDLTTEPERLRPAMVNRVVRWVVTLLLILLGAALLDALWRQARKSRRRVKLQQAQAQRAQEQQTQDQHSQDQHSQSVR